MPRWHDAVLPKQIHQGVTERPPEASDVKLFFAKLPINIYIYYIYIYYIYILYIYIIYIYILYIYQHQVGVVAYTFWHVYPGSNIMKWCYMYRYRQRKTEGDMQKAIYETINWQVMTIQ